MNNLEFYKKGYYETLNTCTKYKLICQGLEKEIDVYKKALYLMAKDYASDNEHMSISYNDLFYAYVNEAKEEIENDS